MNDARFGPAPAVIGLYRIINDEIRDVDEDFQRGIIEKKA